MPNRRVVSIMVIVLGVLDSNLLAWDHPGRMTTAAIAFAQEGTLSL